MAMNILKETSAASVLPDCKHKLAQGLVPLREDQVKTVSVRTFIACIFGIGFIFSIPA